MKKIIALSIILLSLLLQNNDCVAQNTNYEKKWENIDSRIKSGDVKSLNKDLNNIYIASKKEKEYEQSIKSLIYILGIKLSTQDFSIRLSSYPKNESVARLKHEISASQGIERALLQNILAEVYVYDNQDYFFFRHRTEIDKLKQDSICKVVTQLFEKSISNKDLLLSKKIQNLPVLVKNTEYTVLLPSLYDFLVYSYIDYLKKISYINIGVNKKIIQLYGNLIEIHKNDFDKSAYLYNKIQKIKILAKGQSEVINKSLLELAELNIKEPFTTEIFYMIAKNLQSEKKFKKSVELCTNALKRTKPNKWTKDCEMLLKNLKAISIDLQIPAINKAHRSLPLVVSYKNISSFDITIYRNNIDVFPKLSVNKSSNDKSKLGDRVYKQHVELKKFYDYDVHTTIYKLNSLPNGSYKIVLSYNKNDIYKNTFKVGGIFYYTYNLGNDTKTIQFIDFVTGEPLANKKVVFYSTQNSEFVSEKFKDTFTTDKIGRLKFNSKNYPTDKIAFFPDLHDDVKILDRCSNNRIKSNNKSVSRITFFTDRNVYRPSQTIYFKGILSQTINNKSKVIANKSVIISLYKDKEILSKKVVSNEFGSVSGEFSIPNYAIGDYYLKCSNFTGTYSIKIEQYKRPKFYIHLDKIAPENVLDSVNVFSGNVMSYSGFPLQNTKVLYSIKNDRGRDLNDLKYIGSVTTDVQGNFVIKFTPKHCGYDINYYTINISVSDINGETHIKDKRFSVASYPKNLIIRTKPKYYDNNNVSFCVEKVNQKQYKLPVSGKYIILKLKPENRVIFDVNFSHNKFYQIYDYKTFVSYFPHMPYDLCKEIELPRGDVVYYGQLNNNTDSIILNKKLNKGYYLIKALSILEGDTIKAQKVFKVYDHKTNRCVNNEFFRAYSDKSEYNYGEKATLNFVSDLSEGYVYLTKSSQINKFKTNIKSSDISNINRDSVYVIKLRNGRGKLKLILKDKSDLSFDVLFVSDINYYHDTYRFNILPKPINKLEIKTNVFRDKTIPGSKEEWTFTVKGNGNGDKDKDKKVFEVLATMYDASLDIIKSNSFKRDMIPRFNNSNRNCIFVPYRFSSLHPHFIYADSYSQEINGRYNYILLPKFQQYVQDRFLKYFGHVNIHNQPIMFGLEGSPATMVRKIGGANSMLKGYNYKMNTSDKSYSNNEINIDSANQNKQDINSITQGKQDIASSLLNANLIQIRDNFDETSFFYPTIKTDKQGNFTIKFTSPESLTLWKLLLFAHAKDLDYVDAQFLMKTQKKLMLVPNMPRFLRIGDTIVISAKVLNLSGKDIKGHAKLNLINDNVLNPDSGITLGNVNEEFKNNDCIKSFEVDKNGSSEIHWKITVPKDFNLIKYQIIASTDKIKGENEFSDGEQNILPILSNKILITETMPISVKGKETKKFYMNKLKNSKSSTLLNFCLTMNLTTSPIWDAIKSLPYLNERHYESSDQLFGRLYANMISSYLINSSPKIKDFFKTYNSKKDLQSNLEKNAELKSILLEETPWLKNVENENQTIKNLAILFNLNNMRQEFAETFQKLTLRLSNDGGYPWFEGGVSSEMITTNIVAGFGKLYALVGKENFDKNIYSLIEKNINFLDQKILDKISLAKSKNSKFEIKDYIYYLYARSFWKDNYLLPKTIIDYIPDINKDVWKYYNLGLNLESFYAIVLNRFGYKTSAKSLIHNLKERSVESSIMGMYWKNNTMSWGWFNSIIEAQSSAIEAFAEVTPADTVSIEEMKVWLIQNKRANAWNSTKATVEAVNCLLQYGNNWVNSVGDVNVKVADKKIVINDKNFIKKVWCNSEIDKNLGKIEIHNNSLSPILGGLYWQYFENIDKVKSSSSDAIIQKEMYVKVDNGNKLAYFPLKTLKRSLKIGEEIIVRLTFTTDRDMQYIHIKDMRASALEPRGMISGYHYDSDITYFESIKDLSVNFFIEYLPKGVHKIEYSLIINNAGTFSSGITTFQNLYAPEISSHTNSVVLNVSN